MNHPILFAAVAVLATASASAQTDLAAPVDSPQGHETAASPVEEATLNFWRMLDMNTDGKVDRQEAKGDRDLLARFKSIDTNGDGGLDNKELTASAARPAAGVN